MTWFLKIEYDLFVFLKDGAIFFQQGMEEVKGNIKRTCRSIIWTVWKAGGIQKEKGAYIFIAQKEVKK